MNSDNQAILQTYENELSSKVNLMVLAEKEINIIE
jgi:hypothetical protein